MNEKFNVAFNAANQARIKNELPVGCAVFINGVIFCTEHNRTNQYKDPLAHCEFLAINYLKSVNLRILNIHSCEFYITLEPCVMCYGILIELKNDILKYFPQAKFVVYFGVHNYIFGMTQVLPSYLDGTLEYICLNNYKAVNIVKEFYLCNRNAKINYNS